jgi:porphobilinogen deaminase
VIVSPDGSSVLRKVAEGDSSDGTAMGQAMGADLLAAGGKEILEAVYS